ncbi:MAG: hypothetical protein GY716_03180 [bacterium]|nr:hypothetical protein [bacterium]
MIDPSTHDPFDADYTRRLIEGPFRPVLEHYFRPLLLGTENIPVRGPAILAANHSGMAFPYDGIVLDVALWQRDGLRPEAKFRSLFEKQLSMTWWMRPFGLDNFWRRCGGIDTTFENFEQLLLRGDRVIYYPEGVRGIGKGFQNRYKLQPFHTSFVTLAARYGVPVVPMYIINAEWLVPYTFTFKTIDRVMRRLFRVPFLPLPAAPTAMLLPWAWWMALPCRMVFVAGKPIDVRALAHECGLVDLAHPDREAAMRTAERLRTIMQTEMDRQVEAHGRQPFERRTLFRELRTARRGRVLARTLPTGWAQSFKRFERDALRPEARNRLQFILRDWDLLAYYLPFGWPLLSLARNLRRPPYGYRGLSRKERNMRQGQYSWNLAERRLPPRTACDPEPAARVSLRD